MKKGALFLAALLGAATMSIIEALARPAFAEDATRFTQCTVLTARADPQSGPRWGGNHRGVTPIPAEWTVVSGVGTELPGILVCK
ncbi:MAG: hypothetical protein AAFV53_04315 [Myxococcota bacterium]